MAGETIMACRYVKNPTVAIAGVTHISIDPGAVGIQDPGDAGSPGPADHGTTHKSLGVTLFGRDFAAMLALVGAAAANLVVGIQGAASANEKITIKNVVFTGVPSGLMIPANDAGGQIPGFAISGQCNWGASDTFALMVLASADA